MSMLYILQNFFFFQISPLEKKTSFTYKNLSIISEDEGNAILECLLEWATDSTISYSDLYIKNGLVNHICTTLQCNYLFKGCIKKKHGVQFILHQNASGKSSKPVICNVPLNNEASLCDKPTHQFVTQEHVIAAK